MPLPKELIDKLLADELAQGIRASKPHRQTRIRIHFPALPIGGPVTWHDIVSPNKSLRCTSRGCGTPTPYKLRGIPKCKDHLIIELVLELQTNRGETVAFNKQEKFVPTDRQRDLIAIGEYPSDLITDEGLL